MNWASLIACPYYPERITLVIGPFVYSWFAFPPIILQYTVIYFFVTFTCLFIKTQPCHVKPILNFTANPAKKHALNKKESVR